MTKIDIISGFLGAGKTTLIKKLISEAYMGEKLVLIENEFGEIGIDGGFLKDAGIEVKEMNSGCICCSLVGDFASALHKVIETYDPDRILIEPSGVGKLSDVIKAVEQMQDDRMILNSYTTVVDGKKANLYLKNFKEFFKNQIACAHTIIVSRTQQMDEKACIEVVKLLQNENKNASIITTAWDDLDGRQIKEAMEHRQGLVEIILADSFTCQPCQSGTLHRDEKEGCCSHKSEGNHDHKDGCCCSHHHQEHDVCGCYNGNDHEEGCCEHHHANEEFTSWGKETAHTFEEEVLEKIFHEFANSTTYGTILRAKGIVETKDHEWLYFDYVPGEYEIRKGKADTIGKLCVIGSKLNEKSIEALFVQEV